MKTPDRKTYALVLLALIIAIGGVWKYRVNSDSAETDRKSVV